MEIMATATNNHNQKELRLYVPNELQQNTNSTTALMSGGARSPFQREVREWQRIDPDTGALLTGRLEADRWINGPLNKYGKISDSQNISQPNGTQHTQRKQLEVLQTCTAAGGAMQVIRSQTIQTTSSRWSSSSASASPLLLSANTSPIPQQQYLEQTKRNSKQNLKQKTHNSSITFPSSNTTTPFTAPTLLTNGFNHKLHQHQLHDHQHQHNFVPLQQHHKKLHQSPLHSLVNDITNSDSCRNRNWSDLTENMSTLDICDNDHDDEHDHDNDYIVQEQESSDDKESDNNNEYDNDSLMDDNDHSDDRHHHQYLLLNKRNNLKNVDFNKRHSFTVFANNDHRHNDHDSHENYHCHSDNNINSQDYSNNLKRDSSSGSCSNNQLFLLDTAPSLKLSNLMKSSSSLSSSSNNSTAATQATIIAADTNLSSANTHKSIGPTNKISLHAIVGNNNNNNNSMTTATTTTTSSTPSPTTTTRPSWQQQPTIYRQNNHNNSNNAHSIKSRVGDTNNNSNYNSGSDGSRSCADKTEADLRHLQQRQQSPNQQQRQQLHLKQNDGLTPTHLPHSYNRVDLESFRHYNTNGNNDNSTNNDSNYDSDLRLSSRHLRRQQIPNDSSPTSLQRSRSISIDDLSTDWDTQGVDSEEPAEWRRVSKLRRSFQSSTKTNQAPTATRRPLDLPTNSVSVSKIRAELENGRRLNTVMRNNHVDLAALSSILNGSPDKETKSPVTPKRNSFLTAESLKEIRGKLKKLSDESLYKEDFLLNQQSSNKDPEMANVVTDQREVKGTDAKSPDRYRVANNLNEINGKHTTNSLESRLKYRDTNSTDWHIRRKSYGFEKMSPPEKAMLRMDASTDSGLGRSGELQNWSPTSEAVTAGGINRTVVHFGESPKVMTVPAVQRRYKPQKSYEESDNTLEHNGSVSKRHSIAVDESQYVYDNSRQTTQIHLTGLYEPGHYSKPVHSSETNNTTNDRGQQKRVEFSKTEVHFATESGRVNIVETDSKPPPTNNFRRRKSRSSSVGPLQSLVKSATTVSTNNSVSTTPTTASTPSSITIPVTLFGDATSKLKTIASTTVAYRAPLLGLSEPKDTSINVTVTIPSHTEPVAYVESTRSSFASTSGVDTTDCDTDEMTSLRGILKNKPAKPKPYVLGENIDKPDDLWGVQLKPISSQMKTETVFKSDSPPLLNCLPQKSVAERIQELGSAASQSNGFSTKINVSLGNTSPNASNNWDETDLPKSNVMSIKLHSPQAANEMQPLLKVVPPIVKPRTVTTSQEPQPCKPHTTTNVQQTPFQTSLPTKDSLKIIKEARGARQLREHELSYFGVPVSNLEDETPKSKYTSNSNFRNSPKRSLPARKLSEENNISMEVTQREQKWHLENNKPDLLKHNAIEVKPTERISLKKKADLTEEEEHLYENIANDIMPVFKVKACTPPKQYDRKMDLKRDAMILSEMNRNADQTLRELSDEAALKDRRRRSMSRRNSKPLETIDEKSIAEKINDTCIAVKISRGTYSSEAKKTSRQSTPSPTSGKGNSRERTSSQSSVECCPRARSRSLSSEKEDEVTKRKPSRPTQMVKQKPQNKTQSRSKSLDSQKSSHSQYSSGEEQQPIRSAGSFRREDRSRTKTKRITSSASTATRDKYRDDKAQQQHHSQHNNHNEDSKRLSSTTHSSTHRERVECKHDNANGSLTTQQHKHHSDSLGRQRNAGIYSSGGRQRNDLRDSQRIKRSFATASERLTNELHEKHQQSSRKQSTRAVRDDERNSSQRLSSHLLDRGDKEKDKSSQSTRGHSNRSTAQRHHDRIMDLDKKSNTKACKTKLTNIENTTSSKNAQQQHHQSPYRSKERQQLHHKSKRDEDPTEHVHGLKSAIIKTTTKLREKSRNRREKN